MHWTVEPDRGRMVEIDREGIYWAHTADRYLVVRWVLGVGTIEVDCPSVGSARRECRRITEEAQEKRPAPIDKVAEAERRYDHKWDSDQLSLLVD